MGFPALSMDDPAGNLDDPASKFDDPAKFSDDPAKFLDEPAPSLEHPAKFLDEPAGNLEHPAPSFGHPARFLDDPAKFLEHPGGNLEHPARKGGGPPTEKDVLRLSNSTLPTSKPGIISGNDTATNALHAFPAANPHPVAPMHAGLNPARQVAHCHGVPLVKNTENGVRPMPCRQPGGRAPRPASPQTPA